MIILEKMLKLFELGIIDDKANFINVYKELNQLFKKKIIEFIFLLYSKIF